MTSPSVAYAYADGSANTVRVQSTAYPNGRVLDYGYGSSGSVADQLSRIATLTHNGTQVAAYTYLGLNSFVRTDYSQPSVRWDLITGSGANPYAGLDAFGRVIDCLWNKYSSTAADLERVKYGYDRAGNRTWRYNSVAHTNSANFDELYSYDGLYQLAEMQRGSFSGTPPAGFGSQDFEQDWTLDPTGNWRGFQEKAAGTSVTLNQTRTANTVNEITGISNSVGGSWVQPAYDGAGNMTTMPQPAVPANGYTATYDAWNRLVKLVDPATGQTVQENAYDGLTRRTVQKSYSSGTLSETRHYYYSNNWQVLEERLGTSPDTASPDRQFVWGQRYIDDLVLRDRSVSGTLDERLYATQDANWNVTAVCDTSAAVQERYAFSAYGIPMFLTPNFGSRSSSSFDWETIYGGYRYDLATGMYYIRYRDLHPLLGIWISREPMPTTRIDLQNLFRYCQNRPNVFTDQYGLKELNIVMVAQPERKETSGSFDPAEQETFDTVHAFHDDNPWSPYDAVLDVTGFSNANTQLKSLFQSKDKGSCDCVKTLRITGHGGPGKIRIGSKNSLRPERLRIDWEPVYSDVNFLGIPPCMGGFSFKMRTDVRQVVIGGEMFKDVPFCKWCVIQLYGCSNIAGWAGFVLVQELQKLTKCEVRGFNCATIPGPRGGESQGMPTPVDRPDDIDPMDPGRPSFAPTNPFD